MIIKLCMIAIGLIFVIIGYGISRSINRKLKECTVHTTAKIVDIVNMDDDRFDTSDLKNIWQPVIEYSVDNNTYKKKYSYGSSNKNKYTIGQSIEINYNLKNPNDFYVSDSKSSKILEKIFIIVGCLTVIIGIITLFF